MSIVLDTNVVSALRVPARNPEVAQWAATFPIDALYVAAPTIAEIERGVVARERTDPPSGAVLRTWLDDHVLEAFRGRVLPFDLEAARCLGRYKIPAEAPLDDALIAAIADSHDFTVATRNTKHFAKLPVKVTNPWEYSA